MMLREVTIGRSKDCDIYLDERCIYASSHHATIYYDGNQLMYRDCSSNGTMINNVSVKHRAVPIRRGDTIMVAGKYQISWNQIDVYFPGRPQQQMAPQQSYQQPFQQSYQQSAMQAPVDEGDSLNLSKWNWGAFSLYPLWGFFNGCWWAFLIGFFVGWLFPSPISSLASTAPGGHGRTGHGAVLPTSWRHSTDGTLRVSSSLYSTCWPS